MNIEELNLRKLTNEEAASISGGGVSFVGYEKIGTGRVTVIVRGDVSEVQASVSAGIENVGGITTQSDTVNPTVNVNVLDVSDPRADS